MTDAQQQRWATWGIAALLMLHVGLAFDAARQWAPTHDEYWHLPVGLLNLRTGRFDYDRLNPPGMRMLAAIPVWLAGGESGIVDSNEQTTVYGNQFFAANGERSRQLFLLGRCMVILTSVCGGVILSKWCWELSGPLAAVVGVAFWCADPTMIANAALVTTDMGAVVFMLSTLYSLWHFAQRPTFVNALVFGMLLGISQLIKFTCLLLFPLAFLLWFVARWRNPAVKESSAKKITVLWILALSLSLFCLNAGYLFQGTFSEIELLEFGSDSMRAVSVFCGGSVRAPVPIDYLLGLDHQRAMMEITHPVFLNEVWQTDPFPQYYLMTLVYKLPHVTQFLVVLTAIAFVIPGTWSRFLRQSLFLVFPAAVLVIVASCSRMQLGIRYILPALPLLFVWSAGLVSSLAVSHKRAKLALMAATCLMLVPLRFHPHHLGYFNLFAGGPGEGRLHLVDSNIDWGQDLYFLKLYVDEHHIEDLGLAYFGSISPAKAGLSYHIPPLYNPEPGWYAVSVNFVMGRPYVVRGEDGESLTAAPYALSYFRKFKEQARVGSSIYVYHLTEADVEHFRKTVRIKAIPYPEL